MIKSLDIFYSLLIDFVRFYLKNNNKCLQLQTFAVLDRYTDLSSEALNKSIRDFGKPYFYSRQWENKKYNKSDIGFDFPALVVYQNNFQSNYHFDGELVSEKTFTVEMGVVDKYVQDCLDCRSDYCRDRTTEEIYRDTSNMLDQVIDYLRDIVVANVLQDGQEQTIYIYKPYLEFLIDGGKIQLNGIDREESNAYQKYLKDALGNNVNGFWWKGGVDNLYGTFLSFQFKTDICPKYEPQFYEVPTNNLFLDQNCCG